MVNGRASAPRDATARARGGRDLCAALRPFQIVLFPRLLSSKLSSKVLLLGSHSFLPPRAAPRKASVAELGAACRSVEIGTARDHVRQERARTHHRQRLEACLPLFSRRLPGRPLALSRSQLGGAFAIVPTPRWAPSPPSPSLLSCQPPSRRPRQRLTASTPTSCGRSSPPA